MTSAWWPVEWDTPGGSGASSEWKWNETSWYGNNWETLSDHSTSDGGTYLGYDSDEGDLIWRMQEDDWED